MDKFRKLYEQMGDQQLDEQNEERWKVSISLLSEHGRYTSRDLRTLINKLLDHKRLNELGVQIEDIVAREVD